MMLRRKQKGGLVAGCLIPLLTLIGLLAACFAFCEVIYLLNQNSVKTGAFFFGFGG
jgi:hypothetical protein